MSRIGTHSPIDSRTQADPLDDERWLAVAGRDAGADGRFVYAVRGTGIYCRPSCPARRPRRENTAFFDTAAEAARAGFRPCKRCRPDEAASPLDSRAALMREACRAIEDSDEPPSLAELAGKAGLTRFHFQRLFKGVTGVTPKEYAQACRRRRLQESLGSGEGVSAAIHGAGFGSASRVYERSGELLGMSPAAFRRGAPGETIRHALAETSLGWLLVAATNKGLCAIELGDDPQTLREGLQRRFPKARHVPADAELDGWLRQVVAALDHPADFPPLPLDIRGTAFQQRVWKALRDIPAGSTVSYAELAARLGRPGAARAVALACAGNALAVAVPCHRVVGGDGSLRGYRWGLARKKALLDRERKQAESAGGKDSA